MTIHQYSEDARRRIARAVRWVETRTRPTPEKSRRGRVVGLDRIVRAQADIEHGQVGDVKHLAGPAAGQSLSLLTDDTAFKVYNPGPKVWSGSDMMIREFALPDSDTTNQALWYIVKAWSATRIRGKTTAAIAAGASGTLNTITPIDGTVSFTTVSAFLPTETKSVTANLVVWAELVYRTSTGTSRWEIYNGDCPGT